ncbi:hypothetical protein D3C85_1723520 [compost metagenome]
MIALKHERPQTFPAATRHFAGTAQLQQIHRFTIEMTNAMLGKNRQVLTFEPFARKQRAIVIEQEAFRAAGYGPAAGLVGIQYCGGPA